MNSLSRSQWAPARRDAGEDAPIAQLKRALAANFTRVVKLFRQWDVDCSGEVSTQELYDAMGALRLSDGDSAWGADACRALFAALDINGNGSIDFHELHHALRRYDPPPFEVTLEAARAAAAGPSPRDNALDGVPVRRPTKPRVAEHEAVASVKRLLAANQTRVLDLFRKWDYDMSSAISAHELRRALGALSIPIDAKALKTLFHEIDSDGSGEISFGELNAVLRRQVDFDNGGGERFDAASGTYTTKATAVRQVKTTSLPAITTSASVVQMEPVIVSVVPTDASKAAKHAANRDRREQQALMQNEGMERRARATRAAHDVP